MIYALSINFSSLLKLIYLDLIVYSLFSFRSIKIVHDINRLKQHIKENDNRWEKQKKEQYKNEKGRKRQRIREENKGKHSARVEDSVTSKLSSLAPRPIRLLRQPVNFVSQIGLGAKPKKGCVFQLQELVRVISLIIFPFLFSLFSFLFFFLLSNFTFLVCS